MSTLSESTSKLKPGKAAHYSSTLSAALLRGAWADGHAGKDAKGYEVSWGELVRKWGKHTAGDTSLVHHLRDISLLYLSAHSITQTSASGYITVPTPSAAHDQPLPSVSGGAQPADGPHSSTSSSAETGENSHSGSGSSFIHVPHSDLRHTKSRSSFEANQAATNGSKPSVGGSTIRHHEKAAYLSSQDLDGDEREGDECWADGSGWWNGVGTDQIDEVREGIRKLEEGLQNGKYKADDIQTAKLLLGYHHHSIGDHDKALTAFDGVDWDSGDKLGDTAVLERIRGRCLQGMCYELTDSASSDAVRSYMSIPSLLAESFPPPVPAYLSSTSAPSANRLAFEPNRELHRWISTSLCRAAISSSRRKNCLSQTLGLLRTYHAYAVSWPSSFRPHQRQRMLLLYLTALAAGYPEAHASAQSPYLLTGGETSLSARATWSKEAASGIRAGQRLLAQTTSFPRAGEVNDPVTTFIELCVALADRSAGLTSTVVDILWWSMTLTFQSQTVLRHLTRLLQRQQQHEDAKRTFELYVQLVLKSRETAHPEAALQLDDAPPDEVPTDGTNASEEAATTSEAGDAAQGLESEKVEAESDGDRDFIEALLSGAKLLSRDMGDLEDGWKYACLAREAMSKAKPGSLASELRADVEAVLGVIRMAMATTRADLTSRPIYQAQALNHLLTSTKLNPSSAHNLYHLAFAQAEARSIDEATRSIHTSLELDSDNVQAWHLLALLLTAEKDWEGARKACEAGVAVWENDDALYDLAGDEGTADSGQAPDASIESRDFAHPHSRSATGDSSSTIPSPPLLRSSGSRIQLPSPPAFRISRTTRLNQVIRLRMTMNVITEKVQGPSMAMLCQQELFAFFSARSGENRNQFGYGSGSMRRLPSMSTVGGLGGSYVSVLGEDSPRDITRNATPSITASPSTYTVETPPRIIHTTASSSPGNSSPVDDGNGAGTISRDFAEKASINEKDSEKEEKKSSTLSTRKGLSKHLHAPGLKSMSKGRPSSVRRLQESGDSDVPGRNRTASASSTALSVTPSAFHSNFRSASAVSLRPSLALNTTPEPLTPAQTAAESRMLSDLWLMSAATFRRWGKMEQCLVAINEAETLDPENGDVWIQLGLYHSASVPPNTAAAQSAFTKAILLRPLHPAGLIHLSSLHLSMGQADLAHGLLSEVTQDNGWDIPEAWVLLARTCKEQGRESRERECLLYALVLEQTRSARGLRDAVDRWL